MYTEPNIEIQNVDIFKEEDIFQYNDASRGQRFLNLLIDWALLRFGLGYLTSPALLKMLLAISPDTAYSLFGPGRGVGEILLVSYLWFSIHYLVYYTFCEKVFRGYTLGKLITGTRAIREDGQELSFKDAFLRSLSRVVPFEPFSGFGFPWHDRWTNTRVIKSR